jgi:hypothetical protein
MKLWSGGHVVIAAACAALLANGTAQAETIFSDLGTSPPLYDPTSSFNLANGLRGQVLAAQFEAGATANVTTLALALDAANAGDEMDISLWTSQPAPDSDAFQVGTELGSWTASIADTPASAGIVNGTDLVSVTVTGITLTAGTDYWLQVAMVGSDSGDWYENNTSATGLSYNDILYPLGEAFTATADTLPAFSVSGDPLPTPTPEPASLSLLGSGLIALGMWRRRRRRTA